MNRNSEFQNLISGIGRAAARWSLPTLLSSAALWGATPSLIDKAGPAAREIAAIADEVEQICESMIQVKRAASA